MIKNFGIDIVDNSRFKDKVNDETFIRRILSEKEIIYFSQITNIDRKVEYLASRFSAKESLIKALGEELPTLEYSSISVLNKENGVPFIETTFKINYEILLSISHSKENTITQVIIQKIL